MTWLLALYPPRWRRRYGEELRDLVRAQPFSLAAAIDVIAGAIDAWLEPQSIALTGTADAGPEGVKMIGRMMKLGCAGSGSTVTKADALRSAAVNLGGTLLLTLAWIWLRVRTGEQNYLNAFSAMAFLVPYLLSMRYTYLKGRSAATQTVFILGMTVVLSLILGVAGWIAARI